MIRLYTIVIALLLFVSSSGLAQQNDSRCIYVRSGEVITDSLTIKPSSITFSNGNQRNSYRILSDGKSLKVETTGDSVEICYKTLSFDLGKSVYSRSLQLYDSQAVFKDPPSIKPNHFTSSLIQRENLSHQGAITRGFTVGNQQSLTMQSRMNLQLEGKLNDELNVSAQITDQQIPYLPEGNSQYLREYDHVSVRLYNQKFALEAGNQVWESNNSYFGKYRRNVEGARLKLFRDTEKGVSQTTFGASSARGKFSRQTLEVQDGVSGPYRIPRPSASSTVVILPASESVYLDGDKLERGVDNDYVIDYNQGEITFTNNILLTRYSRVIIEFEYTQLSYQQSSIMGEHTFKADKFDVFVNYYRQHDNPRQPIGVTLDAADLIALGSQDPVNGIVALPGMDSVGFDESQLRYARKDTLINGQFITYYIYSINPEIAVYRVSFRETAEGNYIIKEYTAQGTIYEWVPPVNGKPQGYFEPEIAVAPPETSQLVSLGGHIKTGDHSKIGVEYSTSSYDRNNLNSSSTVNGAAVRLFHRTDDKPLEILDGYNLSHHLEAQWVGKEFKSLERFRTVEFDRLWLQNDSVRNNDFLLNGGFSLKKSPEKFYEYNINKRSAHGAEGWMHEFEIKEKLGNLGAEARVLKVSSDNGFLNSNWLNYKAGINYRVGSWLPGVMVLSEMNSMLLTDSLYASQNAFLEKQFNLVHFSNEGQDFALGYSIREDKVPNQGEFKDYSRGHILSASGKFNNVNLRMNYRRLDFEESGQKSEETLAGDINWRSSLFQKSISQDISYGITQGRELKRSFQYVQVMPGEGTHTWRDLDDDNIKDLDEFFEAINIDERNYIKILIPTQDFIPAYETRFAYQGNYRFPVTWSGEGNFRHFLSRLNGNINYRSQRKTSSDQWEERLWLFNNKEDSSLVSDRTIFNTGLSLNRSREKIGGRIRYSQLKRKQWFQSGFQSVQSEEITLDIIYSITGNIDFNMTSSVIEEAMDAGFSDRGSYLINGWLLNPEINYSIGRQWKFTGGYKLQDKEASRFGAGQAQHRELIFMLKHNRKETFLSADLRVINIDFIGEENTATGYALLDAMRPGQNIYWRINMQQKLSNGLRLSIFYDGRKPDSHDAIHLGRIQLTALF